MTYTESFTRHCVDLRRLLKYRAYAHNSIRAAMAYHNRGITTTTKLGDWNYVVIGQWSHINKFPDKDNS